MFHGAVTVWVVTNNPFSSWFHACHLYVRSLEAVFTWKCPKLNLLNFSILFFSVSDWGLKRFTHSSFTHTALCVHMHTDTHTYTVNTQKNCCWQPMRRTMRWSGIFLEYLSHLSFMVHNGWWSIISMCTCHSLFICVCERDCVCVCSQFVCTDIYVCTGTLFKSVNGFLFLVLYSYHL